MKAPVRINCRRIDMPDKEWLEHQYVTLNKPQQQIANESGCHIVTVQRWGRKLNVRKPRTRYHPPSNQLEIPDKEWLKYQRWILHKNQDQIAAEKECSVHTVRNWCKTLGVIRERVDKEWLKHQYMVLGKTHAQIARESGFHPATIRRHCLDWDLRKNPALWHFRYPVPVREELEHQYLTLNKPIRELAAKYDCQWATVVRWLHRYGISKPHEILAKNHSLKMSLENNPSWRGGISPQRQSARFKKNKILQCAWCGEEGDSWHIQLHHIDHNRKNGDPSNLLLLCYHCNLLEAQLNQLQEKGLATFTMEPGERIEVRFHKKLSESLEDSA